MNYCDRIITDKNCNTLVLDALIEGYVNIYVLLRNRVDGTKVSQTFVKETEENIPTFTINEDGYYVLCTIQVPTDVNQPYYYKEGSLYKNFQEITLQEVIDTNPEVSKLNIDYTEYFQLCRLKQCYIKSCLEIFNSMLGRCGKVDSQDSYKRDLLLSAINVIEYMIEKDLFAEAERLLNRITGCNGLCENSSNGDCGCVRMS